MTRLISVFASPVSHFSMSAAENKYLSADGMLNLDEILKLNEKVKTYLSSNPKVKADSSFVIPKKAKPIKYSAVSERKGDHKYLVQRALKIAVRKRVTAAGAAKNITILSLLPKGSDRALEAEIKKANSAITAHVKKATKILDKVKKERADTRAEENATFNKSLDILRRVLLSGGIKSTDMVESTGMFGSTLLVRLSKENIITVGKGDVKRFSEAVKAAKSA